MELYTFRHAESANNANPLVQRIEDPPLTEWGRRQAGRMARWLPSIDSDLLITSPFRRALETSRFAQEELGLLPNIWTELHEQGGLCQRQRPSLFPRSSGHDPRGNLPGVSRLTAASSGCC